MNSRKELTAFLECKANSARFSGIFFALPQCALLWFCWEKHKRMGIGKASIFRIVQIIIADLSLILAKTSLQKNYRCNRMSHDFLACA